MVQNGPPPLFFFFFNLHIRVYLGTYGSVRGITSLHFTPLHFTAYDQYTHTHTYTIIKINTSSKHNTYIHTYIHTFVNSYVRSFRCIHCIHNISSPLFSYPILLLSCSYSACLPIALHENTSPHLTLKDHTGLPTKKTNKKKKRRERERERERENGV